MISIITVNFNAYDFLDLLIESLEQFSHLPYELIVIDNSVEFQRINRKFVHHDLMPVNVGHGQGLNLGVRLSNPDYPFCMFLDVDTHFLAHRWEIGFIGMMKRYDVIGGRGVPEKPIRPACMFMKKEFAHYDWRPTENYKGHRVTPDGTDVAIAAYHKMLEDKVRIGFLDSSPNRYGTATGEEWSVYGVPVIYHHWHGSHLENRQVDFEIDLQAEKRKLFESVPWRLP